MSAKDLQLKPISKPDADKIIKNLHYSGKVTKNSQLNFGIFLNNKCGGALQFGPSLDKAKIQGLVKNTSWNGFLELNRAALADWLPKNSESRSISIACKVIQKQYPHIEWIVSFADGTLCGHGTIYQASNFLLTGITPNKNLARLPDGTVLHKMTCENNGSRIRPEAGGKSYFEVTGGRYAWQKYVKAVGGEILQGFQFRYLKPLNPTVVDRLSVPIIPYSKIKEIGGEMYKGKNLN